MQARLQTPAAEVLTVAELFLSWRALFPEPLQGGQAGASV
jgi:hypothetical protein